MDTDKSSSSSSSTSTSRETESTLTPEKAREENNSSSGDLDQPYTTKDADTSNRHGSVATEGGNPHQPTRTFAEGLKFVDTPDSYNDGPDARTTTTAAAAVTKSPAKTQIVFRPIDEAVSYTHLTLPTIYSV